MTEDVMLDYAPATGELGIDLGVPAGASHGIGFGTRNDEMIGRDRSVRHPWRGLGSVLSELGPQGLSERNDRIARLLEDDGVTYRVPGSPHEMPWSLDPLPLLIAEDEWGALEHGLQQRAELLDHVITDLYGERRLIADGLIPPEVVYAHPGFLREAYGIRVRGPHQLVLHSADLVRDGDHRWRLVADRTQAPSGAGYAMENRTVISRALPDLYRGTDVHRLAPFFHGLRQALFALGPENGEPTRVVLLTSGAASETAFDQAFLSALLGLPLVEGSDLVVRDERVWQESLGRLEPVDVILRRVDSDWCDPLELRPESRLGTPALLEAARAGTVAVVNGFGAGVLENPALFPFLPGVARAVLGTDLALEPATTFWCGDDTARRHVVANLDRLVIKPLGRSARNPVRFGWEMTRRQRSDLARRIEATPYAWVGQEPLAMSTAPTLAGSALLPRPVTLRTFAVAGADGYHVMRGGLSRIGQDTDALMVSNSRGASSKDVWVLSEVASEDPEVEAGRGVLTGPETVSAAVSPRVAEDLFWLGRYSERVESIVRLLRVIDVRWRDDHPASGRAVSQCLAVLQQTLGAITDSAPPNLSVDSGDVTWRRRSTGGLDLATTLGNEDRPGTLAFDLRRVRELATTVRDQLSPDTWTVLSGLDRAVGRYGHPTNRADALPFSAGLAGVLQAMLAFSGLVGESMVRDEGWFFLDAGRRLERGLQITALLRHALAHPAPPPAQGLITESVLVAAESIITHRRRYPARAGLATVVDLLVADPGNPRSVAFQLDRLDDDLAHIRATGPAMERARAAPGRVRARLIEAAAATEGGQLSAVLDEISAALRGLYDDIDTATFSRVRTIRTFEPYAISDISQPEPEELAG